MANPLTATIPNAEHREIGGIQLDIGKAGACRVKRMIYPLGYRWSTNMKPAAGTELCVHSHAGFLAQGQLHFEYADGCVVEFAAPHIVEIAPGHDAWVVGDVEAVLIEFDFERETAGKLAIADHKHT